MSEFIQNNMAKAFGLWYPGMKNGMKMEKAIARTKCHIEWITTKNGVKKRIWVSNDKKKGGEKQHTSHDDTVDKKESEKEGSSGSEKKVFAMRS